MATIKTNQFISQLTKALNEKDVENLFRELIKMGIPDAVITSPYGGDGVLKSKANNLVMLMEFKFNYDLQSRNDIAKVLIQALYYLKKSEVAGDRLPSIIFVGDKDECFVIHINSIQKYLDADIDWSIAPSSAPDKNPDLKIELINDETVNPFVFDLDNNFDFADVVNKILDLNSNVVRLVRITEKNIGNIFDYFCSKVIPNSKANTNEKVGLFINILTNPKSNYIHPTKKNTLVTPNGEVTVVGKKFESFFSHFERDYKPTEKEKLVSACDRLLEDKQRRQDGAFFTPTLWVDEAHKMVSDKFGDDWKDEYVVWDCACGTGNLTRDYRFKELYCSTLNGEEIDIMKQNNINDEATRFQYNFLDSVIDEENLPVGLVDALKNNKKIIFLINPPYARANNKSNNEGESLTSGMADTFVADIMKENKIGQGSSNLYTQFLYKIAKIKEYYNLTDVSVNLFCPTLFLTGSSFKGFRNYFFDQFSFDKAMLFKASHFADVSSEWGIMFSQWTVGKTVGNEFEVELKDDIEEEII